MRIKIKRSIKPRVGALITVGGARTENWLSLSRPSMYAFTIPCRTAESLKNAEILHKYGIDKRFG